MLLGKMQEEMGGNGEAEMSETERTVLLCSPWRVSSALSLSRGARTSEAWSTNDIVGAAQSESVPQEETPPESRLERGSVINSLCQE